MNPTFRHLATAAALFIASAANAQTTDLAGLWQGSLSVQGTNLRTVVALSGNGNTLKGLLSVPQQGLQDLALSSTVVRHDSLLLRADNIQGRFAGRFAADGQSVAGMWYQGGMQLPLTLRRSSASAEASAAPRRPQVPVAPFPYRSQDLTFSNSKAGIQLAGTLTLPAGKGPFPAVVLVSGSGPEDRNETVFGHQPFLVLADYLTRQGFAVLRYDDRGTAQSGGTFAGALTADFTADAQAALAYLRTRPDIRHKQVGLIGHSEGGLIAWQAAAQPAGPDFVVSLAGPGVSGDAVLLRQQADLARAAGADSAAIGQNRRLHQALFAGLRRQPATLSADALTGKLASVVQQQIPGISAEVAQKQVKPLTSPWMRSFLLTDPATYLSKVKCPVLALNGSHDLQVAADQNLPAIEQGLRAAHNTHATVQTLPNLNHLFQTDSAGTSQYATIEETFAPSALQVIGNWLNQQVK
ncbi:alpha/beta hydrolase family protein [Hymenobacter rigui]|uniref:Alpha/beta fold hydrolase n=1 Tax=Hymenobacter rigui TaxID=334424 RepID=A0A3R9PSQ3_9BACT|nr:alpha/beta fold hydrolase [Hymenobacter rigui]RSK45035.1 alpha/beta fold hydrolase [Hymenobacter rigui]